MKRFLLFALVFLINFPVLALDVQRFNPTTDQYEGFTNFGTSTLKSGAFHIALFVNHVDDPLEFNSIGSNTQIAPIVAEFNTVNLTPQIGILDWLSVGASLPFNLMTSVRSDIPNFTQEEDYSLGDAQVYFKMRIMDNKKSPIGLAFIPTASIPLDDNVQDHFNDLDYSFGAKLALDTWLNNKNYLALNVGGSYRMQDEDVLTILQASHDLDLGISYVHHFSEKKRADIFAEVTGRTELSDPFASGQRSPVEALLGLRFRMLDNKLTTFLGGGRGVTNGYSSPDYRIFAGIQFSHRKDQEKPKPAPEPEEKPKEIPNIAQIYIKVFDENKDPLSATILVRDPNGDLAARADSTELRKNLKPADYDVYVEKTGYTYAQKTVTLNQGKRANQTIILGKVKKKGQKIEYLGKILFDFNKANLQQQSYQILDNVVDVLQRHQEVNKVRVEAHTDSKGSELYNLNLSKARAKSVMDYLVSAGVSPERLISVGLGESQPIDTNDTEEGRANNRRVEFTILESKDNAVRVKR
ncbi:MAG TPA: OmpA family protein [Oligoflexia bacterium]|nr:OmpA family protein [Oligoflexia bacterium]